VAKWFNLEKIMEKTRPEIRMFPDFVAPTVAPVAPVVAEVQAEPVKEEAEAKPKKKAKE
jgi:hypothetical protein